MLGHADQARASNNVLITECSTDVGSCLGGVAGFGMALNWIIVLYV